VSKFLSEKIILFLINDYNESLIKKYMIYF